MPKFRMSVESLEGRVVLDAASDALMAGSASMAANLAAGSGVGAYVAPLPIPPPVVSSDSGGPNLPLLFMPRLTPTFPQSDPIQLMPLYTPQQALIGLGLGSTPTIDPNFVGPPAP